MMRLEKLTAREVTTPRPSAAVRRSDRRVDIAAKVDAKHLPVQSGEALDGEPTSYQNNSCLRTYLLGLKRKNLRSSNCASLAVQFRRQQDARAGVRSLYRLDQRLGNIVCFDGLVVSGY